MISTTSFDTQLARYINLLLRVGVNLQPGQNIFINMTPAPVEEVAPIARIATRMAYGMGARNVYPLWNDADTTRARLELAPEEALTDMQTWRAKWLEEETANGAAMLTLDAEHPGLFEGIATERLTTSQRAAAQANVRLNQASSKMLYPWAIGAVATKAWATKVYPHLSEDEAVAALWQYIFKATRVDQPDPIAAWHEHLDRLGAQRAYLNTARFRRLHYSAPGTQLSIDLPDGHVWLGGGSSKFKGSVFVPNLPTEEVFSMPARNGVNGTVSSTMPLNYNGVMIEGIRITFVEGRITSYTAEKGEDALKSIIETDEGSHYLGEVALVSCDSPLNTGTPVLSTLFDENASCHIAIGRAYPTCIEGGENMTPEELSAHGVNMSNTHVDFMIGSPEMDIDGETASGERIAIFRNGLWAERSAAQAAS